MSLYRVRLSNIDQGRLDRNPYQQQMPTSIQRSIYVAGPFGTYRKLMDGSVFFEDTTYWKQFAYPQVSLSQAFIDVLGDQANVSDNFSYTTGRIWRGQILNSPPAIFDVTDKTHLSFSVDSDDFAVLMPIDQEITSTYDSDKNFVYTLPKDKYIIFNNTSGWFIPGPGSITITDGRYTFFDEGSNFNVIDLRSVGFSTRDWSQGVEVEELANWGVIDPNGIAYFKFVFFGDSGGTTINSITTS
jgi:hypothetical protein